MIITAAKAMEAAKVLGVELAKLDPDALSKAYRTKSKECHPDTGNYNAEQWARISWAKEVLARWLEKPPAEPVKEPKGECRACGGLGRVPVRRTGFGKPVTLQCVMCNGTGDVTEGGARAHYGRSE